MWLLFILILSLEATVGLPLFAFYLSYRLISRRRAEFALPALLIIAFFLAIFYSVSWPLLALLLLIFHLMPSVTWQTLAFVLFNILLLRIANLRFNYFYLFHWSIFLLYVYQSNFKNYKNSKKYAF